MESRHKFEPRSKKGKKPSMTPPKDGKSIASLVIGVVCIVLIWVKFILIFLAPIFMIANGVGIWLAMANRKENAANGHATVLSSVALIVNIVSLSLYVITVVACTICTSCICAMAAV